MALVSTYPTGVTVYIPEKCWNGYTLFQARAEGAMLINMNGQEVHLWKDVLGFPNKMLPDGSILTNIGEQFLEGEQGQIRIAQVDWNGRVVWSYDKAEEVPRDDGTTVWMGKQHHDIQREGNPVGYYSPGQQAKGTGTTLVLAHKHVRNPEISDKLLLDDWVYELDDDGTVIWEWLCSEHFDEFGFDEQAKNVLYRNPGNHNDWMHINSLSAVGPNKWFDAGDERFHPDNLILDSRAANIIFIVEKSSGRIVWELGPKYDTPELKKIGWIVGQHHAHIIPRGLPGEGNLLLYDNGGTAGYGAPMPQDDTGLMNIRRDFSRVLEIDPVTLAVLWQFPSDDDRMAGIMLYSPFVSGVQRLENGNTFICQGIGGRMLEVTPENEIVWEYISPYCSQGKHTSIFGQLSNNMVYRAYRVPYDWAPIKDTPAQTPVKRIDNNTFRVPGASEAGHADAVELMDR